jgi:hypothetical protein
VNLLALVLAGLALAGGTSPHSAKAYHPHIDPANFQATVDHAYFPLVPGTTYRFLEKTGKHESENVITVTHDTKTILGVRCIVVHDVLRHNGALEEETFDWYAQDKQGNVWYFGEDTKELHKGGKVDTEGSWEAGVDGAEPGIIMPAAPRPGAPYRQEYLAGHAEDMGQIVATDERVTVPYGTFTNCVRTKEWSMLEAGSEKKWYAKGIGFVRSESTDFEVSTLLSVTGP